MAEARKCDRCHEFYDIPKEQQGRDKLYDLKGAYIKLLKVDNRRDYPEATRWYDLCPKCVELLEKWLANPDDWKPEDCLTTIDDDYAKAIVSIKTYKEEDNSPNELKEKIDNIANNWDRPNLVSREEVAKIIKEEK